MDNETGDLVGQFDQPLLLLVPSALILLTGLDGKKTAQLITF